MKKLFAGYQKPAWYEALLCFLMAAAFTVSTRVHLNEGLYGTKDFNYISDLGWKGLLLLPAAYILLRILTSLLFRFVQIRLPDPVNETVSRKELLLWAGLMLLGWLPYYMSFYPGGVYADTLTSIQYLQSGLLTNRHPLMYTQLLGLFLNGGAALGLDINRSMGFFTLFQLGLMGLTFLYLLCWMGRMGIGRGMRSAVMAFMTFFPLVPLYGISVWKDTPFCLALLLWCLWSAELYMAVRQGEKLCRPLLLYVLGSVLTAFTRNNGLYVVLLTDVVLLAVLMGPLQTKVRRLLCTGVLLGSAALLAFIQGPGYTLLGVEQTNFNENLAIPLQQIAAVVSDDGNITEEQKASLNAFIPYENIAPHYSPLLADNIKWAADMDEAYLDAHRGEFFRLWLELFLQNPKTYTKAWLLQTVGFWNCDTASNDAYVQTEVWPNPYGLYGTDYFEGLLGFSFARFVTPRWYISSAWLIWLTLIGACLCMKLCGWRTGCLFVPQAAVWATVMIATPIAFSLRYVAALLFCLPLTVLLPIVMKEKR